MVALHPEGVDRNRARKFIRERIHLSPSTRRAWIEIPCDVPLSCVCESPSTRRAWIEIGISSRVQKTALVALHPEGVDRNASGASPLRAGKVALHPEGVDRNKIFLKLI